MDVAREVDAVLELAGALAVEGRDPRHRRERERLAQRPQQVPARVVERRDLRRRLDEHHARPAVGGGDRDVDERAVADELQELGGDEVLLARQDLDDAVLGQRGGGQRGDLDADVDVGEAAGSIPCAPATRTRREASS